MRLFINRRADSILITSFKVMYSTLKNERNLKQLNFKTYYYHYLLKKLSFTKDLNHFLIVRNPYTRLESFYKNKFCRSFSHQKQQKDYQKCHRLFFPLLDLTAEHSYAEVRSRFLSVSFEKFISFLPSVYTDNPHLHPQSSALTFSYNYFFITKTHYFPIDRIFKIENSKDLNDMANLFSIDLRSKRNSSPNTMTQLCWTEKSKSIAVELYAQDFDTFKYSK